MYKDKALFPTSRYLPLFGMIDNKLTIIQSFDKALIVGAQRKGWVSQVKKVFLGEVTLE